MLARFPLRDDEPATAWMLDIFSANMEMLTTIDVAGLTDIQDSTKCLNEINDAIQLAYSAEVDVPPAIARAAATWSLSPK